MRSIQLNTEFGMLHIQRVMPNYIGRYDNSEI